MPDPSIHYYGIRHHGPGSARRLVQALDRLQPAQLLIEGPSDTSELLPLLADPALVPPVAVLTHAADRPERAIFHPFAAFSPEFQAIRWAAAAGVPVQFIDVPAAQSLAGAQRDEDDASDSAPQTELPLPEDADAPAVTDAPDPELARDPIGVLARAAGYADGESWWHDWIESAHDDDPEAVFAAVADAMSELRGDGPPADEREAWREAQMRVAIASVAKAANGPVAVVCGAWHVPALRARHKLSADRALLSGRPRIKVRATVVPWTGPRLASGSGYGAGVDAPRWYAHLWAHAGEPDHLARWMTDLARVMRDRGVPVSTAAVIEGVRLADALAALRERPAAGYEDMRDAVIASLCHGEALVWQQLETELLLGRDVGTIPPGTPLMPLLEDLQRQQKATRLKPEALEKELALDLRSDAGSARSQLLHRLNLLDLPWGRLSDAGRSRGTFRERWTLAWEPEFSVRLVEQLVHGTTIEQAASRRSLERIDAATGLATLTTLAQACMEAALPAAVDRALARLAERAGHAQECGEMLDALPELIALQRYGTARALSLGQVGALVERLTVQAALALPYAARQLDADQAGQLAKAIDTTHQALTLAELPEESLGLWWQALTQVANAPQSAPRVAGLTTRLLYEADRLDADELQRLLARMLSPGTPTAEAAPFFEGVLTGATQRLLYDDTLLAAIDGWLQSLENDTFAEQLPLFRRVFSVLDRMERRRLLSRALDPREPAVAGPALSDALWDGWYAQRDRLLGLMREPGQAWTA